jgi:hypothetical protein
VQAGEHRDQGGAKPEGEPAQARRIENESSGAHERRP